MWRLRVGLAVATVVIVVVARTVSRNVCLNHRMHNGHHELFPKSCACEKSSHNDIDNFFLAFLLFDAVARTPASAVSFSRNKNHRIEAPLAHHM